MFNRQRPSSISILSSTGRRFQIDFVLPLPLTAMETTVIDLTLEDIAMVWVSSSILPGEQDYGDSIEVSNAFTGV
jgi:hypothetical protein